LIDYLKKKAEELADTLIEPVWKHVLAWPWKARALVLLIGLGIVYVFSFPASAKFRWSITSNIMRVAWAGESRIPISSNISSRMKETVSRLSATLESNLDFPTNTNRSDITPWTIAQATLANYGISNTLDAKQITSFVRSTTETTCGCWREIPGNLGKPRNIFVSGWVLLAFAKIGEHGTRAEFRFLIDEQHQEGWWSVFPVAHESPYASSYGTAWALLGLNGQFTRGFVDVSDARRVSAAIQKGSAWLLAQREQGSRWKDYPLLRNGKASESISGLVLHALHQTIPKQLQQVDREWLDNLPTVSISAGDIEHPYFYFMTKDGYADDSFVQTRLPWLLVGTADAYRNGSLVQRAKALTWLEKALDQRSVVTADTAPDDWLRAELLYAIRYVLERSQ